MKKTQIKDTLRNIRKNFVSWLAIVVVTMIAGGVYCGVSFFLDAHEQSAADFLEQTNFEDLLLNAPRGITEDEYAKLLSVDNVLDAEGTYRITDAFLWIGETRENAAILSVNDRISRPDLIEGKLPSEEDECALTAEALQKMEIQVGDSIKLSLPGMKNSLSFIVTGSVKHPEQYIRRAPWYVFLPKKVMEFLIAPDKFNYVMIDADIDENVLSDVYFKTLETINIEISDELSNQLNIPSDEEPGFIFSSRDDKEGFAMLRLSIRVLNGLGMIFTFMFIFVGFVIVFSTITMIIDGQKKILGSMKAFGFRNNEIMLRYIVYSVSAILTGMVLSIGVTFLIQYVIFFALKNIFCKIPDGFTFKVLPYIFLLAIQILSALIATVLATRKSISKYSATELMHWSGFISGTKKENASNPAGTLYSRLILRNMRSDLPRVLTSIIIITGSCLMICIGLTLRQALQDVPKNTMKKVTIYDLEVTLPTGQNIEDVKEVLKEYEDLTYADVTKNKVFFRVDDTEASVTIVSAASSVYNDYVILNSPDGRENLKPNSRGVLLGNRISEVYGVKNGDTLEIFDKTLSPHEVRVSGVVYIYFGKEIYVAEKTYEKIFGHPSEPNTLLVRLGGTDREVLTSNLTEKFPGVQFTRMDIVSDLMTAGFNALVIIMLALSMLLSVFVLLNLVNIFVSRRKQELIVMRINGFSHSENIGYLMREAVLTIICGLLLGTGICCLATESLAHIIENNQYMAVRSVNWSMLGIAAGVEAFSALTIYLIAFRRIRHLSLVDTNSQETEVGK